MRKKIYDKLTPVYEEIWNSIKENYDVNSLSEFRTRVGHHYKDENDSPFGLLIAGRCPNGWDEDSADQNHIFPQNNSPLIDVSKRIALHFILGIPLKNIWSGPMLLIFAMSIPGMPVNAYGKRNLTESKR